MAVEKNILFLLRFSIVERVELSAQVEWWSVAWLGGVDFWLMDERSIVWVGVCERYEWVCGCFVR